VTVPPTRLNVIFEPNKAELAAGKVTTKLAVIEKGYISYNGVDSVNVVPVMTVVYDWEVLTNAEFGMVRFEMFAPDIVGAVPNVILFPDIIGAFDPKSIVCAVVAIKLPSTRRLLDVTVSVLSMDRRIVPDVLKRHPPSQVTSILVEYVSSVSILVLFKSIPAVTRFVV
jgi:hypothetical protein